MVTVIQRISDGKYISEFKEGDGHRQFTFTGSILSALPVGEEVARRLCDLDFCTGKPLRNKNIEYRRVLIPAPSGL
jgi:hypothetical protein